MKLRHAIYEQARTALHQRLGNDPQISDAELVNEHHRLETIYTVEEDLLLSDMRRFVRTETALSPSSFISKLKEFVRYRQETSLSGWPCFDVYQCADCDRVVGITSRA